MALNFQVNSALEFVVYLPVNSTFSVDAQFSLMKDDVPVRISYRVIKWFLISLVEVK